jgi:hypothetical protein
MRTTQIRATKKPRPAHNLDLRTPSGRPLPY